MLLNSHQEPMMRSTPNEFTLYGNGTWDYTTNAANIKDYWLKGTQRAKNFESVYTVGMRGFGDLPLSPETNVQLLEQVMADQTNILKSVYGDQAAEQVPQIWALYKEVEGYYDAGMTVPDYVTLLWSDDNWGNIRRLPLASERGRSGGAGVYYHVDYVGSPRDFKWITSTQISKIYEQMTLAVERDATRLWILNVGDLKPYERETEFFLNLGWNATRWTADNVDSYVATWAQREFGVSASVANIIVDIVGNLTRYNSRRKPELLNSTTYSLINYREADTVLAEWGALKAASTKIYDSLSSIYKPAFFQLVQHPVLASANVANLLVTVGLNNLRASQARLSTNILADQAVEYFEGDFDLETQYHQLLDGKWDHMMDQTHLGYYYWQQPMTNSMPAVNRVQAKKQALAGVMRIVPEGTNGAWPVASLLTFHGYSCPPPTIVIDRYSTFSNIYIDVGAGGPTPFTFTVASSAPWVSISTAKESVSPQNPEQRVYLSVKDWHSLSVGTNTATITVNAISDKNPPLSVSVTFNANKPADLPGGFKGFVEGSGVISMEAAHATRNSTVNGIAWKELPGYGRTLSGVTTFPRDVSHDVSFSAGTGPSLEYDFYSFNTISNSGNITATIYVSPSWNAGEASRPLAFAAQLDGGAVQAKQFFPKPKPGDVPGGWDGNDGFVANNIITVDAQFTGVLAGKHTFKISAIEPAVVIQKIVINTGGILPSYLGPPQSFLIK
ncbi:hypothetical protein H0H87_009267 [Tephrocybe sp. NHM501043]|nr:hypothetical protein H0H87_009267 [Tephrocybe sp. NHM501043]